MWYDEKCNCKLHDPQFIFKKRVLNDFVTLGHKNGKNDKIRKSSDKLLKDWK